MDWTAKDMIDLILKESAIVSGLWQNYATISGVLIAFSAAAKVIPWWGRLGAASAFWIFSWGNRRLIIQGTRLQNSALTELENARQNNAETNTRWPIPFEGLKYSVNTELACNRYHFVIDAAVTVAIFLPAILRG